MGFGKEGRPRDVNEKGNESDQIEKSVDGARVGNPDISLQRIVLFRRGWWDRFRYSSQREKSREIKEVPSIVIDLIYQYV